MISAPNLLWQVSIIDQCGEKKFTQYMSRGLSNPTYFILRNDLLDEKNKLLTDDTLTLFFSLSLTKDRNDLMIHKSRAIENADFYKTYKQRKFTDLTLKFGDNSIPTHRVLLASRSDLLKDRLEKLPENSNVLDLEGVGVEFEVAEQVINFLYDERVEDMEKHAKPLLAAAVKLEMRQLELVCVHHISEKLCLENALETLKLSAQHGSEKLQNECTTFIEK